MKQKNKKYLKAMVSLGVGAIILTCAVFANYENAGGYSVCKSALKKVAFSENFSVDYTMDITLDNESYAKQYGSFKLNAGGNPAQQSESTDSSPNDTHYSKNTLQDNMRIYQFYSNSDFPGYIADSYNEPRSLANDITGTPETGEKLINFAETLSDTLIGDLKNSFVLTSEEGGIRKYNVSLSKDQLPSYVAAGVNLMTSLIRQNNTEELSDTGNTENEPLTAMFGSGEPYVRDVNVNMSVNDEGNPVQIEGTASVIGYDAAGNEHTIAVNLSFDFYDFGTTEIDRVSDEEISKLSDRRIETIQAMESSK